MSGHAPESITDLLLKWSGGDATALEQLMPLVYDELRRLAVRYLRLVDQQKVEWQSRAQFYGLAARVMRNILVDHARSRQAAKRGGEQFRVSFDSDRQGSTDSGVRFLAVHEALERLAIFDAQKAQIVELRFFGGLSIEETAEVLGIGHATVERDWKLARAWLKLQLE